MCRLAYVPARSSVSKSQLLELFKNLEKSVGGHGNGYAVVKGSNVAVNKGLKLSCKKIVEEVYPFIQSGCSVYFHTRKVSVGWKSDKQCHPFRIVGKFWDGVMCHNGTWQPGNVLAKFFETGSDTATLAHLVGKIGVQAIKNRGLWPTTGVFMFNGSTPGRKPVSKVLYLSGDLEYCPTTKVWASEFDSSWDHYSETYYLKNGEHDLNKVPAKLVTHQPAAIKSWGVQSSPLWSASNGINNWSLAANGIPSSPTPKSIISPPKMVETYSTKKFEERAWDTEAYPEKELDEHNEYVTNYKGYHV